MNDWCRPPLVTITVASAATASNTHNLLSTYASVYVYVYTMCRAESAVSGGPWTRRPKTEPIIKIVHRRRNINARGINQ